MKAAFVWTHQTRRSEGFFSLNIRWKSFWMLTWFFSAVWVKKCQNISRLNMQTFPGSVMIHCDHINKSPATPYTLLLFVSANANILSVQDLKKEHKQLKIYMNQLLNPVSCTLQITTYQNNVCTLWWPEHKANFWHFTAAMLDCCYCNNNPCCWILALFIEEESCTVPLKGLPNIYGGKCDWSLLRKR